MTVSKKNLQNGRAPEAEVRWDRQMKDAYGTVLMRKAKTWFTGYNANTAGRYYDSKPRYPVYNGGAPRYRRQITEVADNNFEALDIT